MQFSTIPIPGAPENAPRAMQKEVVALAAAADRLAELREEVNVAEEQNKIAFQGDGAHDRAPHFELVSKCYGLECEVRDRLNVYLAARALFLDQQRSAVTDQLVALERKTRDQMGLDATAILPISCLQVLPEWHGLRRKLGGLTASDNATAIENDSALLRADEARVRYQQLVTEEPKRLKLLMMKRQRDAQNREAQLAAAETIEAPRRERESRVQALFKTK